METVVMASPSPRRLRPGLVTLREERPRLGLEESHTWHGVSGLPRFSGIRGEAKRAGGCGSVRNQGCFPAEGGVSASAVVEAFDVFEDCVGELDPDAPSLPVEQFGLHAGPEGLDDRVIVGVADRAERRQQVRGPARWVKVEEVDCAR